MKNVEKLIDVVYFEYNVYTDEKKILLYLHIAKVFY